MDIVQEEKGDDCYEDTLAEIRTIKENEPLIIMPEILIENVDKENNSNDLLSTSRRPSSVVATLRRPSQAITLSALHVIMKNSQQFSSLFSDESTISDEDVGHEKELRATNNKIAVTALTTILSALYAKLLVVLGMAFPITQIISPNVDPFFYQGFYLYLYFGSILFVACSYISLMIDRNALFTIFTSNVKNGKTKTKPEQNNNNNTEIVRYGSFYLRLGAIAFGIGSMVYSGLEFGRYFELKNNNKCFSNVLQAITPATRMILTLVQVQFIFLNNKHMELRKYKIISKFGIMHMIATNVCEWLYVLIEETKHEIVHLSEYHGNLSKNSSYPNKYCEDRNFIGVVVTNASTFLFPCTIEYSLICAVILFELWKHIESHVKKKDDNEEHIRKTTNGLPENILQVLKTRTHRVRSHHHFTVDCSNAHRGLFAGILVIVLTIISLIMFFVLTYERSSHEDNMSYKIAAQFQVNVVELVLYMITAASVIIAMIQMRDMTYKRKRTDEVGYTTIGLDNALLVVAQTGMFIYCMFSIIGSYFLSSAQFPVGLLTEIFSFIQTCLQTMFVLDGCWRKCRNIEQTRKKPGRELITFLIIANMAMWTINALEKNRAEFRPTHLQFYGDWPWTIITHISMPLAIFYRFHSTICLFEIWKNAYKPKRKIHSML